MTPELEALVDKGRRSLAAARLHQERGDHDFAVSRAYYAMFYLATALLATLGHSHRRHSRVVAAFGREFARTGILDARHHTALREAFDARAIADHGTVPRITPDSAAARIEDAAAFIAAAEAHLRRMETPGRA